MDCNDLIEYLSELLRGSLSEGEFTRELFENIYSQPKVRKINPISETSLETYKGYFYGTPVNQFARKIRAGLSPTKFADYINQFSKYTRASLAKRFVTIECFQKASADDIGEKLANLFTRCIESAAKTSASSKRSGVKAISLTDHNKLLMEANYICPNCRNMLLIKTPEGEYSNNYKLQIIDPARSENDIENLLAVCPDCSKTINNSTEDSINKLKQIKENQVKAKDVDYLLSLQEIEDGVEKLLEEIQYSPTNSIQQQNFNPVEIRNKIPPFYSVLVAKATFYSTTYFNIIDAVSQRLAKENKFDFDEFAREIHDSYKICKENGMKHPQIFQKITDQICPKNTNQRDIAEAVVSYFIQICEVFDVIS